MKKITFSLFTIALGFCANAQDISQIEKDILFEKYDTAKEALYKLIRHEKKPLQGKYYYNLGKIHIAQGYSDSAKIYFDRGLKSFYDTNLNNLGIGRLSLDNGNDKEARSKFNAALHNAKKGDISMLLAISKAYLDSKKPDAKKALEYAQKAEQILPNSIDAKVATAEAHLADGSVKLAWAKLLEAKLIKENDILLLSTMAKVHQINNDFDKSIELLNRVIEINPENALAYKQLAFTYLDFIGFSGDTSKRVDAVTNYEKFHQLIGKSYDADNAYAEILLQTQDYKKLLTFTNKIWKERGDNFKIYKYAGIAAFEDNRPKKAYEDMWQYFDVQDKNKLKGIDYLYLGLSEVEKSKKSDGTYDEEVYAKAIKNIQEGISRNQDLTREMNNYALNLFKSRKYYQAYFLYDLASKNQSSPSYAYDNYYKGNILYIMSDKPIFRDQLQKSLQFLDEAIKNTPSMYQAHLVKARVHALNPSPSSQEFAKSSYKDFLKTLNNRDDVKMTKELEIQVNEAKNYIKS